MKPETPIYSTHDEDITMRECVEGFVYGLADHIDDLQDAELAGDFPLVERLCRDLIAGAGRSGYPALIDVAGDALTACATPEPEDVRKHIVELTELAQRVRRGSRGAA